MEENNNMKIGVLTDSSSYLTKEHLDEITNMENIIKNLENEQSDIYEFLINKYTELRKTLNKLLKGKFLETKFIKKK